MPRQGFRTITVSNETYSQLAYLALDCKTTIPKLLESLSQKQEVKP